MKLGLAFNAAGFVAAGFFIAGFGAGFFVLAGAAPPGAKFAANAAIIKGAVKQFFVILFIICFLYLLNSSLS
jgi:hypothetical protein